MKKTQRSNKNILGDPNRGNYQIWIISALLAAIMDSLILAKLTQRLLLQKKGLRKCCSVMM